MKRHFRKMCPLCVTALLFALLFSYCLRMFPIPGLWVDEGFVLVLFLIGVSLCWGVRFGMFGAVCLLILLGNVYFWVVFPDVGDNPTFDVTPFLYYGGLWLFLVWMSGILSELLEAYIEGQYALRKQSRTLHMSDSETRPEEER